MANNYSGGIGLAGLLTIIFVIAKLAGVITWPWWLVLSPWWISVALALGVLALLAVVAIICAAIDR
jgi:hypothetical protein